MIIEVVDKINGSKFDLSNIPFVNDIETAKAFLMDTSPFFNSEEDFKRYEITFGNVLDLFRSLTLGISNSDLYNYSFKPNNSQLQTHSLLFQKDSFCDFNPNPNDNIVGTGLFYNSTRSQIKEIGDSKCN